MNDCMFYKSQLQGNPTFTGFVEPHSRGQIWRGRLLSSQEPKPKILQLEQVDQDWARGLDSMYTLQKDICGLLWKLIIMGRRKYLLSSSCCFLKSPLPQCTPYPHSLTSGWRIRAFLEE